jgi:4-amino-4-deoxy-L-arabinose transferase-like glycosyltransferase
MALASPVPVSDYGKFRELAQDLLAHDQFGWPEPTAYRFPAYPFLLAVAMRVSASPAWLRLVDVLLSAVLVPAAYALAKRLANGDGRYGLAAAWVCALNPAFVFWAPILASEHPFALLAFLGLAAIARPGGASVPGLAFSGVCLGLASLTRGEGLFQVPTFLLTAWLVAPEARLPRRLRDAAVLLVPVVLLVGAWTLRNTREVGPGSGVSTSGGVNFYMGHGQAQYGYQADTGTPFTGLSETEGQAKAYGITFEALRKNPLRFPRDVVIGTWEQYRPAAYAVSWGARLPRAPNGLYPEKKLPGRRFFSGLQVLGYAALCLLALCALFLRKRMPRAAWLVPLSIAFWNWVCYAVVFNANARYRYLGEAAFCLLAASAVAAWSERRVRA